MKILTRFFDWMIFERTWPAYGAFFFFHLMRALTPEELAGLPRSARAEQLSLVVYV